MSLRGEPPFVLALDVGTSSTRALLFDARGKAAGWAGAKAKHNPTTTADGGAFLDPDELFQLVSGCLEEARRAAGDAPLAGLAMDSFWHSLMGLDARGRPTTPVFTWADTRATAAANQLRQQLDEEAVHARTGCRLHASYWPAKLIWLSQADGAAFRRTKRWLSFAEYCQWRLTGELACSVSMASGTGLLNRHTCEWDSQLLRSLPIEPGQLSPLIDLKDQLPGGWLPAIGDGAASNAGSGAADRRRIAVNVGTSSAMRLLWPAEPMDIPPGLWSYRADRRRILVGGALGEGGNLWAWLHSSLRLPSVKASEAELMAMEPDAHGLTVLPFIAGERSPGWAAAGLTISGANLNTRPIDLMRAALEAVAYRLNLVYRQLEPFAPDAELVASGAAILGSPAWLQILADTLNRPIRALKDREATVRGAALLALQARDLLQDVTDASFEYLRIHEPDPARHSRYQQAIVRQDTLYRRLLGSG